MNPTHFIAWCRQVYFTRQLKLAIRRRDLEGIKRTVAQGARLNGWKGKGPYLSHSVHAPSIRMTAHGALGLAYLWRCSPEIFAFLLEQGAIVSDFNGCFDQWTRRAWWMDGIDKTYRYQGWLEEHGQAVEGMLRAFGARHALALATVPAHGVSRIGRL